MKVNKNFNTNENRLTALARWEALSEVDKELYTTEYATAIGTDVAGQILTGGEIQNIWAVKSNEVGTEMDRKIHRMVEYFRQCESFNVMQIPEECVDGRVVSALRSLERTFEDTDADFNEHLYSVTCFEELYQVFPEDHECYPDVKALNQVCRDLVYSYIQITTT